MGGWLQNTLNFKVCLIKKLPNSWVFCGGPWQQLLFFSFHLPPPTHENWNEKSAKPNACSCFVDSLWLPNFMPSFFCPLPGISFSFCHILATSLIMKPCLQPLYSWSLSWPCQRKITIFSFIWTFITLKKWRHHHVVYTYIIPTPDHKTLDDKTTSFFYHSIVRKMIKSYKWYLLKEW